MKSKPNVFRADQFSAGSVISIDGVPSLGTMILKAITPSACYVLKDGAIATISCGSPCFLVEEKVIEKIVTVVEPVKVVEKVVEVVKEKHDKPGRPQGVQGKLIEDKLNSTVLPDKPFTSKMLSELTGIDQLHLIPFLQNKCVVVGEAEKVKGQRGRTPKLYSKKV